MNHQIPWRSTLNAKVSAIAAALLALLVVSLVANSYTLASLYGDTLRTDIVGVGRSICYRLLYHAERVVQEPDSSRAPIVKELNQAIADMDERYRLLQFGDSEKGIPTTPREIQDLQDKRSREWSEVVKPAVQKLMAATSPESAASELATIRPLLENFARNVRDRVEAEQLASLRKLHRFQWLQFGMSGLGLLVVGIVVWGTRGVSRRIRLLAATADRITGGELNREVEVAGSDEVATLGAAFNGMTENLRARLESERAGRTRIEELLNAVREAIVQLSTASTEILATTTQQAAGAQEQSAAVAETVSTVAEINQTANQATERAKAVAEAARRAEDVGQAGRKAVADTIAAMEGVRQQVESIAENILTLAERAQAIGEIIATVNDVADRTNLLALNAAIEASRAGEQGKGFAVVAGEVKALAEQSKKSTEKVREILGEIQQATNTAVLSTEQGTRAVSAAGAVVARADETITDMAETIADSARSAAQIVASAGQQAGGMAQVGDAMRNIEQATRQALASTRQAEQAAKGINQLGLRLKDLVEGNGEQIAPHLDSRPDSGPHGSAPERDRKSR